MSTSDDMGSSPPSFSSLHTLHGPARHMDEVSSNRPGSLSGDMNSRTQKRYRDNRPDEAIIHQNTLSMMYTAAYHDTSSMVHDDGQMSLDSDAQFQAWSTPLSPLPVQKTTLHNFWQIKSTPGRTQNDRPEAQGQSSPLIEHMVMSAPALNGMNDTRLPATSRGILLAFGGRGNNGHENMELVDS
ncbi:hypothetical protein FH972_021104 [Carpinus fangiana]|uniref:Uncharacterized protein n=1 Tax=Carpinus fangiana TaxID=176857 RepID=A0A5N6KNY2_9ROSI|nr:hypothetical protein FH972_021104 [Carpinus fangiana]